MTDAQYSQEKEHRVSDFTIFHYIFFLNFFTTFTRLGRLGVLFEYGLQSFTQQNPSFDGDTDFSISGWKFLFNSEDTVLIYYIFLILFMNISIYVKVII